MLSIFNKKRDFFCLTRAYEVIEQDERFKYMGYDGSIDLFNYMMAYLDNPMVEMLGKLRIGHLCVYPTILKKLEKDKDFRKYVYRNAADIRSERLMCNDLKKSFKLKWPVCKYVTLNNWQFKPNNSLIFILTIFKKYFI